MYSSGLPMGCDSFVYALPLSTGYEDSHVPPHQTCVNVTVLVLLVFAVLVQGWL